MAPDFRFAQISPLLLSFSRVWSSFIGIKVLNKEEYSMLRILYCYSLQQHIFLAFCNNFDTHYRILAHILLRNETLLFPKWRQKPIRPILRYSSVVNMEMCKIINFENPLEINDNFFAVVIRRKRIFILAKNIFWGWWHFKRGYPITTCMFKAVLPISI